MFLKHMTPNEILPQSVILFKCIIIMKVTYIFGSIMNYWGLVYWSLL